MNKKILPFVLIVALALIVFVLRYCTSQPATTTRQRNGEARRRGFDRNATVVEYTAHARCRMNCREISTADVQEIMKGGKVNYRKSDVQDKPCPTYALEGYTSDREHLRVVFAQCSKKTRVVTCINIEEDFECHCPGDKKKAQR